ncbi:MAG: hypothetical protein ACREXV_18750, partial [Polaromonas sp.]
RRARRAALEEEENLEIRMNAAQNRFKQVNAPSGGSAVHAMTSVGARFAAGPPQGETAPSGGSAVREATSVGAYV